LTGAGRKNKLRQFIPAPYHWHPRGKTENTLKKMGYI